MTLFLPATPAHIDQAAHVLRAGGLVAFPTETVYGLGANAYDETAVAKIFIAKGRPATDPLIVHIHRLEQLADLAIEIPELAYQLAEHFWAGALTLILQKSPHIPLNVTANLATVAVRMPNHPVALALLEAAQVPICAPSANLFSHTSPTTAEHVQADLEGRIDLILDGGATTIGVESTIVDITGKVPLILRPGGITLEQLQTVIPTVQLQTKYIEAHTEAVKAPGMLLKHYSPRAKLVLLRGEREAVLAKMQTLCHSYAQAGEKVGVLAAQADLIYFAGSLCEVANLGSNLEEMAQRLFDALRSLDQKGVTVILAQTVEPIGLGRAIADRLLRAAEGKILDVSS